MKHQVLFTAFFAVSTWSVGCGRASEDEFREGYPRADLIRIEVPGTQTTQQGIRQSALEGQTARMYSLTRAATVIVNGSVGAVLGLLDTITEHAPTTLGNDTATWGPHTAALSPNTWKLTVKRIADATFSYELQGKPKSAQDSAFVTVLSGTHHRQAENFGAGDFVLDWDQAQTLPEHDRNVGKAHVTYSRSSATGPVTVAVSFSRVRNEDTGDRQDAEYRYTHTPGADGKFEFATDKDVALGAALERLSIKSRWKSTGEGRSDVRVQGGDFTSAQTLSECWDSNFSSRYSSASWDPQRGDGLETVCAFTPASYSEL